jgi:hypothetical protein
VRIVAGFTGDVAQHDAALRPRLRHPDRLVVESRQHSLSDLRQVREEIGWIAGTGLIIDLAPGQSASIPIIYRTASTREDLGYVVPPGTYWLKVQMRFRHGLGGPPTHALTAP